MAKMKKLLTPKFRGSFVNLIEPRAIDPNAEAKYSMLIPIAKSEKTFLKSLRKECERVATEKFGKRTTLKQLKLAIKDGDEAPDNVIEATKDCYYFTASSKIKPGVISKDGTVLQDHDEVYSGAWYRAAISVYAWQHPTGGKGVSINLLSAMKVADDEAFGPKSDPYSDFSDLIDGESIDDEEDEDDDENDDEDEDEDEDENDVEDEDEDEKPKKRGRPKGSKNKSKKGGKKKSKDDDSDTDLDEFV